MMRLSPTGPTYSFPPPSEGEGQGGGNRAAVFSHRASMRLAPYTPHPSLPPQGGKEGHCSRTTPNAIEKQVS